MKKIFIILIAIGWVCPALAADCTGEDTIVVTSPREGARTLYDGVTVRGFVCGNFPLIEVRNETTQKGSTITTTEVCVKKRCTSHFAVPMRSLVLGSNTIKARIPGEDIEVQVEIVRTAWVGL